MLQHMDAAKVRFPPPFVFVLTLAAGLAVSRLRLTELPLAHPLRVTLGAAVAAAGIALIISARLHFLRTGQSPIPWKPTPELIVGGPYRFTRNPMYVGAMLITVGLGIALDAVLASLAAPVALAVVHFIAVRPEERYLRDKFGAPYEEYLRRVRRYL
jgi:protein-S-isoprenylcysteine O-methyltransferase Ste14